MNPQHVTVTGTPSDPAGQLTAGSFSCEAMLGRAGLLGADTPPAEGDGATPQGTFAMHQLFYRPDRVARPTTGLPVIAINPDDGWCDDPEHALYNRPVKRPFGGRTEALWRDTRSYDYCIVLGFNLRQPVLGRGSAIFFHLTRQDSNPPPTEGCVAIAPKHMEAILPMLSIGSTLTVKTA